MIRKTVSLDSWTLARLEVLGEGKPSVGIRLAVLLLERIKKVGYRAEDIEQQMPRLLAAAQNPHLPAELFIGKE